jgi:hypothetical protein
MRGCYPREGCGSQSGGEARDDGDGEIVLLEEEDFFTASTEDVGVALFESDYSFAFAEGGEAAGLKFFLCFLRVSREFSSDVDFCSSWD